MIKIQWLIIPMAVLISTSAVYATGENSDKIRCADLLRSPTDPRWVDLVSAIDLFDFSKEPVPVNENDLLNTDSENLNRAVQSRLKVLKSLFDNADHIESAQLLLSKFDDLENLPERMAKPELLDRDELMAYLAMAKGDIRSLERQAFALTLLTLATGDTIRDGVHRTAAAGTTWARSVLRSVDELGSTGNVNAPTTAGQ